MASDLPSYFRFIKMCFVFFTELSNRPKELKNCKT